MTTVVANARRSNEPATVPANEDAYAAAEQAGQDFVAAVRRAIAGLPRTPDVDGPAAALTEALARIGAYAQPVLAAASGALSVFWSRPKSLHDQARRDDAAGQLPAVVAALDQALSHFDRQAELNAARREVSRLNAERSRVLADLEQAVAAADVDMVLRLRPRIEVELPAALDAARLAVAELELAKVESTRGRPQHRAAAAGKAEKAAQAELEQAQQRLESAQAAARAASEARFLAEQRVAQVAQSARDLAAEVDRLRSANAASLDERLRRLAGLPAATPTAR